MQTVNEVETSLLSPRYEFCATASRLDLNEKAQEARGRLLKKIEDKEYVFEEVPCFCESNNDLVISQSDKHGLYCPHVICRHCGLIRLNPRLTQESYKRFYDEEFRILHGAGSGDRNAAWDDLIRQGEAAFSFFAPFFNDSMKTVFEVGCFMGAYLLPFKKRGWDVAGNDFGSEGIAFGKEKSGISDLYAGGIEQLEKLGKKADVVLCNHVIEHFAELEAQLKRIRELLNPGGLLLVGLPGTFWWPIHGYQGDILQLFQISHCWQFSLDSFQYVMNCLGFEMVYGDEMIRAVFRKVDRQRSKQDVAPQEYTRVMGFLRRMERWPFLYRFIACTYSTANRWLTRLYIKDSIKRIMRCGFKER